MKNWYAERYPLTSIWNNIHFFKEDRTTNNKLKLQFTQNDTSVCNSRNISDQANKFETNCPWRY